MYVGLSLGSGLFPGYLAHPWVVDVFLEKWDHPWVCGVIHKGVCSSMGE